MDIEQLKLVANRVRQHLQEQHSVALGHNKCLDLIAAVPGLKNWPEVMAMPERIAEATLDEKSVARLAERISSKLGLQCSCHALTELLANEQRFYLWNEPEDAAFDIEGMRKRQRLIETLTARTQKVVSTSRLPEYFLDGVPPLDEVVLESLPEDTDEETLNDEALWRELIALSEATEIDAQRIKKQPLLARIADPVELVREYRYAVDVDALKELGHARLLYGKARLGPEDLGGIYTGREAQIWVEIVDDEHADPEESAVRFYSVKSLVELVGKGKGQSIELCRTAATLACPWSQDGRWIDAERFLDDLDAHSAYMNDVWKVLTGTYLPSAGFASHLEWQEAVEAQYLDNLCFAVVQRMEKAPGSGVKGVAQLTLQLLEQVINDAPLSAWNHLDDNEDDDCENPFGRLMLFVFPVPGTEPTSHAASPLLRSSLQQVSVDKKNPEVEATKKKLTRHFTSLRRTEAARVVNDPWSYPTT